MPERAEIEAVESVIAKFFTAWMTREDRQLVVREIIAALDRVRDARGDDEAEGLRIALKRIAYGLEGEMGRYDAPRDDTWWGRIALEALARSPQGEDHERS
jgi:predicted YcjX-like family ATPase